MANQPSKYSKFLVGAASAALVASAVAPVASAADFTDTKGNTHEEAINALVAAGIANGYKDGSFKPNKELTRADVVKFLGKWLVSQGKEIPSDAVSNPRFKDLKPTTEKELLEYAAVAYDNGVFNGSNGNLLPSDKMTRQNMANVIVRAFDNVNGFDLVEYVESQTDFKGDVKDLSAAYEDTKGAIKVVDFFDITNPDVANFRPKDATTRGQFASFLNRALDTDFSAVSVGAVKAINNTTVEVTFKEVIEDVKALDFTIEGLTVSNAVVKQTGGNKTVVLTTTAQEADKSYTLNLDGKKIGTFKGVSAVIPTAIKVTAPSQQGVIGNEVTVSAQVTVPDGQSKAGIPVTFNIQNTSNDNKTIEVEAFTNAEGVATHTYPRYYNGEDNVAAYATSKSTVVSNGKVYWAAALQLSIKDITTETTLVNGAKKVYEINSPKNAGKFVFVAFEENLNKTPDKLTKSVSVEGLSTYNVLTDNTVGSALTTGYPYEITTGAKAVTAVKLDASGKANLVLTGTNGKVTPIVYEAPHVTNVVNPGTSLSHYTNVVFNPTALQAKASTATFELKHTLGLTIEAAGVANAATYQGSVQTGGRDYTITYTDKDGKPASATNSVIVAIPTSSNAGILDKDGNLRTDFTVSDGNRYYPLAITGTKGQAKFTVASRDITTHVSPIVFVNNGTGTEATKTFLDASDLQAQGENTYFVETIAYGAELSVLDKNDDATTSVLAGAGEYAKFVYSLVDQNGKPRAFAGSDTNVSFQVTAGTGVLTATNSLGVATSITQGNPKTITTVIPAGQLEAVITVSSLDPSAATVTAIGSRAGVVLPTTDPTSVSVSFTKFSSVVTKGLVANVNKTANTLTINGVPYNYTDAAFAYNGSTLNIQQFETTYLADGVTVSVTKDADGKLTFNIVTDTTGTGSVSQTLVDRLNIINESSGSVTETKVALRVLSKFAALSDANQTTVATAIEANAPYADIAALEAELETQFDALEQAAFEASVLAVVTAANSATGYTPTYAKLIAAVEKVEDAEASVLALKAVTNTAFQAEILSVVAGLTATSIDTDAVTFNAAIASAIGTATATVNSGVITAALLEVNTALIALDVASTPATGAQEYLDAAKALTDNATILGLNLSGYNALPTTATKEAALVNLAAAAEAATTGVGFAQSGALNGALQAATDVAAARIVTAVYNDGTGVLTLTFNENIDINSANTADIDFTPVLGGTSTVAATSVSAAGKVLTMTLTTPVGVSFETGVTISNLIISAAGTPVALEDANGNVSQPTDFVILVN